MGCYVNPPTMPKEQWLQITGKRVSVQDLRNDPQHGISEKQLPVCLVDNGAFTAAGVAFNASEFESFARDDGRYKEWFLVEREALRLASDLKHYE